MGKLGKPPGSSPERGGRRWRGWGGGGEWGESGARRARAGARQRGTAGVRLWAADAGRLPVGRLISDL